VRAAPLRFNGAGTLKAGVRCQIRLAAEVPSAASNGCCLRNHPDRDTAPSPRRNFTIGQQLATRTPRQAWSDNNASTRQTRTHRKRLPTPADLVGPTGARPDVPAGVAICNHANTSQAGDWPGKTPVY
jgi:hypothetical protein